MAARIAVLIRGGFIEAVCADEPLSVLAIDKDMDGVNSTEIAYFTDDEGKRYPAVPKLLSSQSEFSVESKTVDRLYDEYRQVFRNSHVT